MPAEKDPKDRAAEIQAAVEKHDAERERAEEEHAKMLDKVLAAMEKTAATVESLCDRMDKLEQKRADETVQSLNNGGEVKKHKAPPMAEQCVGDDDGTDDPTAAKEVAADSSRADSERQLEHQLALVQERFDSLASLWGEKAPPPMSGEKIMAYRKRLLRRYLKHSPAFAKVDLDLVSADANAYSAIESQVIADSMQKSNSPDVPDGVLRMRTRKLPSGHIENTFVGSPLAWMNQFASTRRYVTKIRTPKGYDD